MSNRRETIERIIELLRENSTQTLLLHAFIAEQVGLSPTDHKALDLIVKSEEGVTAGKLAEMTRLTTGAVTGVIDRLEKAGFVRRVYDKNDRRRVIIQFVPENAGKLFAVFETMKEQTALMLEEYTNAELKVVADFIEKSNEFTKNLKNHFSDK